MPSGVLQAKSVDSELSYDTSAHTKTTSDSKLLYTKCLTALENWPDLGSSSTDESGDEKAIAIVDFGSWPSFDASPIRAIADAAPARVPSSLSKAQLALVVAQARDVPPLPGSAQLKRVLEKEKEPENIIGNTATISMGTIRLGCYTEKSYIQLLDENRWRSVCYCGGGKCQNHQKIMREIFAKAVKDNLDEDAMRRERDILLGQDGVA